MKSISKLACAAALVALSYGLCQIAHAENPKTPGPDAILAALTEVGKPGAEHRKLDPLVGDWNFTMKFFTDPSIPPAEMNGTLERKWIMDGRFVLETVRGECAKCGKVCEGMGLIGYNNAEKRFTCVHACGVTGCMQSGTAVCDASGKRFESVHEETCPLSGKKVKSRDEIVIESNDRIVVNFYHTIDGQEAKFAQMISVRQK